MHRSDNHPAGTKDKATLTFRHWLRLLFTIFSLFLMGDVFYRWDAFKFHSSFSEFLPNVSLAMVVWSVISLVLSIITWLPLKAVEKACSLAKLKVRTEHIALSAFIFILAAAAAWAGKKLVWAGIETSYQLKLAVIGAALCVSLTLAWLLKDKAGKWTAALQERITPLAWLSTLFLALSILIVGFQMTGSPPAGKISALPAPEAAGERPNILLVTFDAMTARNMSVYGYGRETTPFITRWAETASVFTRTNAESSYTAATTPSMMTGKRTWTHRKYHHDTAARPVKAEAENLMLRMREEGYHTSAFIANSVTAVSAIGISGSMDIAPAVVEFSRPGTFEGLIEKYLSLMFGEHFSTYNWIGQDDFIFTLLLRRIDRKVYDTEFPPELAFNMFLEMIDNKTVREPFIAWIHIMPPHAPYSPPEPFAGRYNPSWELREKNRMYSYNPEINRHTKQKLPFPDELKEKLMLLRDYYDEFILYCDKQFENFIAELGKREQMDNTVIILSSDHGESFFEHDYFQHGPPHLYEQVTHIPLIIKEPGQAAGRVVTDIVEQIDIPATILDMTGIPAPSWMEGRSLLPLMNGRDLPAKTALSVSLYNSVPADPITTGTIAVWQDDYKMIYYLEEERSLLFNLREDPDELTNLADREPATAERLLGLIMENLNEANKKIMAEKL